MRIVSKTNILLLLFILITMSVSMFPVILMGVKAPRDRVNTGIHWWENDYYTYVSFIETGVKGSLKEYPLYTEFYPEGLYVHGIYTVSGIIGHMFGFDSIMIYHLDRLVLGIGLIIILFFFYRYLFRRAYLSFIALIAVFWIPGFPDISHLFSIDRVRNLAWVQQLNILTRSSGLPHYLLSCIFFTAAIFIFIKNIRYSYKSSIMLSLIVSLMIIGNPANLLTFYAALTCYFLLSAVIIFLRKIFVKKEPDASTESIKKLIKEIFLSDFLTVITLTVFCLPVIYYYQKNLVGGTWGKLSNILQFYNLGQLFSWQELLANLGPVAVLSIFGAGICLYRQIIIGRKDRNQVVLLAWFIAQFTLYSTAVYLRLDKLRFIQSLYFIPMAYFAVYIIKILVDKILTLNFFALRLPMKTVMIGIIGLLFVISFQELCTSFKERILAFTDYKDYYIVFFPTKEQYATYKFLEKNTPFGSRVLALYESSKLLPALSGNAAIHDMNQQDENQRHLFFSNVLNEKESYDYLKRNNYQYIWYGYQEKWMGLKPENYTYLNQIYKNNEVTIYQVN